MRKRTSQYAIDLGTGYVISRVNNKILVPVINFEEGNPDNNFEMSSTLQEFSIYDTIGMSLKWTKKIDNSIKNLHREKWNMKLLKPPKV